MTGKIPSPAPHNDILPAGACGNTFDQVAALCFRETPERIEFLLITSRRTHRWLTPKGWPIDGLTPAETAAQEAWEEAGVSGTISPASIGTFTYVKTLETTGERIPCTVAVFALEVDSLADEFPERGERRRKWFSRKKAARRVGEPDLARILAGFIPCAAPG